MAKKCPASSTILVGAQKTVKWGFIYDLAAGAVGLSDARLDTVILLEDVPNAGRPLSP
jgi:hypothetical protein